MKTVIMLNVVMLSVVAPYIEQGSIKLRDYTLLVAITIMHHPSEMFLK